MLTMVYLKKHISSESVWNSEKLMNIKTNLVIFLILSAILFAVSDPSPPLIPELQVVSNHGKIVINWNFNSENSISGKILID